MKNKQTTKAINQARGFKQAIDSQVWDADSFTDQDDMDCYNMDTLAAWCSSVTIDEPDLYHVN
jgi:hypothetical protein